MARSRADLFAATGCNAESGASMRSSLGKEEIVVQPAVTGICKASDRILQRDLACLAMSHFRFARAGR